MKRLLLPFRFLVYFTSWWFVVSLFLLYLTFLLFKKFFQIFYLFFRQGEEREKEGEKHQCVWEKHQSTASPTFPPGDLAHNPGMCPDWEYNQQPSSLQSGAQPLNHTSQGLIFPLNLFCFCLKNNFGFDHFSPNYWSYLFCFNIDLRK